MKFKTDENIPDEIAKVLSSAGYDAMTIMEQNLGGSSDDNIASICKSEERTLIILDKDFPDIRLYPSHDYFGIIVFRPQKQTIAHLQNLVQRLLLILPTKPLIGRLWVVDETHLRVRS